MPVTEAAKTMRVKEQLRLDYGLEVAPSDSVSTTFQDNMKLPVHRWMRYSAGFSGSWARHVIEKEAGDSGITVLDPFVGSGTTILAAEEAGMMGIGLEAHPFVVRMAEAKLERSTDVDAFRKFACGVLAKAESLTGGCDNYQSLIRRCYSDDSLRELDSLRLALDSAWEDSPAARLTWLTLVSILRKTSHANTAQWQYVLPSKSKSTTVRPFIAFRDAMAMISADMRASGAVKGPRGRLITGDARTCEGVDSDSIDLVVTSPPYPNNYDYADATRLEMSFMQEITGWGDLHDKVRKYLMRSCSQHTPEKNHDLNEILSAPELSSIRDEIVHVCRQLSDVRATKGGKKTYHLMIAAYFRDIAFVWLALRRVCKSPSRVCFVIGDSAPYGIYVPVVKWMEQLAMAAGFSDCSFEKTRDRNIKWKNRKHRVPLQEGRFWVRG